MFVCLLPDEVEIPRKFAHRLVLLNFFFFFLRRSFSSFVCFHKINSFLVLFCFGLVGVLKAQPVTTLAVRLCVSK